MRNQMNVIKNPISATDVRNNSNSHSIGNVDGVRRCIYCEIGSWNAWKELCDWVRDPMSDPHASIQTSTKRNEK